MNTQKAAIFVSGIFLVVGLIMILFFRSNLYVISLVMNFISGSLLLFSISIINYFIDRRKSIIALGIALSSLLDIVSEYLNSSRTSLLSKAGYFRRFSEFDQRQLTIAFNDIDFIFPRLTTYIRKEIYDPIRLFSDTVRTYRRALVSYTEGNSALEEQVKTYIDEIEEKFLSFHHFKSLNNKQIKTEGFATHNELIDKVQMSFNKKFGKIYKIEPF